MNTRPLHEQFDLQITEAGQRVKASFEVDAKVHAISGFALSSDFDELMLFRGRFGLWINEQLIHPEEYEAKLLVFSLITPIDGRYKSLKEMKPGNGIIEAVYTDVEHPSASFQPYRVTVYLESLTEQNRI